MPHVIVKLWPGNTEAQKTRLAEKIAKDVIEAWSAARKSVLFFLGFYLADLSIADIAAFEQASENTIKQRLHRARGVLAAVLTESKEVGHA